MAAEILPYGAFAPVPTPVDRRGFFDPPALERHLAFLAAEGLEGALILGTNGEFPSFDLAERKAIAAAAARCRSGLDLMLGVGSCALTEVIELVRWARELGFGSVLCPPPFFFRAVTTQGLASFFRAVLDAAELPVLLYHVPQITGVAISDDLLNAVADHPLFGGVKDSSGDRTELERFIGRLGRRSTMVGHDRLLSMCRALGGSGSITAAASVVPALVAATQRDPGRQPELDEVRALLEEFRLGPAVKAILRARGIGDYRSRPPLLDLEEDSERRLIPEFERLIASDD